MDTDEFTIKLNQWGHEKVPFLFIVDFEMENPFVCKLEEANSQNIWYAFPGSPRVTAKNRNEHVILEKHPISFEEYRRKFDAVARHLFYGDSFLTNLTIKTPISTRQSLLELFFISGARYKLLFKDSFLVFSPETFVRIKDGNISTFPMKGTIDAAIPNAQEIILKDQKELSEHVTIVDLMRNDLSLVSSGVAVNRFRYVEEVKTSHKNLLQVSSEIIGKLPDDYRDHLGSILMKLLPAGSVSGAPKSRTLEIIRDAELEKRGYYTGVFGYFDGETLDSGVMIRFIEKSGDQLYYRSGGGVTTQSSAQNEFQEAIDKIYVPVD